MGTFLLQKDLSINYGSTNDNQFKNGQIIKCLNIIESYKSDFGKHLDQNENEYVNNSELTKILQVFNAIPIQLGADNNKFKFDVVKKGGRFRDFESSIT